MNLPKYCGALALSCLAMPAFAHVDETTVASSALAQAPEIVECTLENGDAAECAQYVVKFQPDDLEIGPFCPETISDTGGIWDWDGENAGLYRVDGDFLKMLSAQGYQFYDADGTVHVFDIRVEGPTETNECIAGSVDTSVTMTVLIPVNPVMADAPSELGTVAKVGLGIDGVPIFADAPSVLDTGHMPALDVCGGHVDPGGWYHWHATASDIETPLAGAGLANDCALEQDSSALFAYAFDGFAIYGHTEVDGRTPTDLDECNGHVSMVDGEEVYHYHATETFPNLPTCLVGVSATGNFSTTGAQGIGAAGGNGGPQGERPDFAAAAQALGVDERVLMDALTEAGGPQADLNAVAEAIGVNVEDLQAVMPRR